MFSKDTYISRRKSLKNLVHQGIIFFPGNGESGMNYRDNCYPFRQDSTFLYYTGINNIPDICFIIDVDNDEEILFGDDLTPEDMVWTGAVEPLAEFAEKSGIARVKPLKELPEFLKTRKKKGQRIHYLPPYRGDTSIQIGELLELPIDKVEENKSEVFIKAVVQQRSIKSAEEIAELEKAVNITAKMHLHAIKNAVPGRSEKEIAGELQAIAIAAGGNISFPIILTRNGQYLHKHATEDIIQEGDIILCDCGAETSMNYAGDMTRTFPAGKSYSPLQKEVYNIVLNAHNTAVEALKPGVLFKDVHLLACTKIAQGLKEMGLMKGNINEAVANGAHTLFFQCGLGHFMGMDIHDMENLGENYVGYNDKVRKSDQFGLKSLRLGKALEPGNVLTVEPGIYFNPFLIDSWEAQKKYVEFVNYDEVKKFKNFGGIRIEEDFLITASGSRLLGKPLAKSPEDMEKLKSL
jgi:Xaa-Pro aminopeptidase